MEQWLERAQMRLNSEAFQALVQRIQYEDSDAGASGTCGCDRRGGNAEAVRNHGRKFIERFWKPLFHPAGTR